MWNSQTGLRVSDIDIDIHQWFKCCFAEFRRDCLKKLQDIGDQALESGNYGEAIKQYTAVEPLIGDGDLKHELLLKRSKAHAEIVPANWREALQDAEEVASSLRFPVSYMILYAFFTRQSG